MLTVPEPPPRIVAEYPVDPVTGGIEERPAGPPPDQVTLLPPDEPSPAPSPENPGPVVEPADARTPTQAEVEQQEDTRVRRQLTAAPDQELEPPAVESTLAEATALLRRVDRSSLDSAGRAQYETARRFLDQAQSALAADSVVFAYFLGQKALTLASGL